MVFIPRAKTYETVNPEYSYYAGAAFGNFQAMLADIPATLGETIPDFHNMEFRLEQFHDAVKANAAGRLDEVKDLVGEIEKRADAFCVQERLYREGKLKKHINHCDTKVNNMLFDGKNGKVLCVIDLDTVMPGLVGFDFGDAIRFTANTCDEDEKDVSIVKLDMDKFEAFTRGFLSAVGQTLSENEKNTLALGAVTMTVECGMRFLTDYLDGDKYFKISREEQNLDRARCQLALAEDMITRIDEMNEVVDKYL